MKRKKEDHEKEELKGRDRDDKREQMINVRRRKGEAGENDEMRRRDEEGEIGANGMEEEK